MLWQGCIQLGATSNPAAEGLYEGGGKGKGGGPSKSPALCHATRPIHLVHVGPCRGPKIQLTDSVLTRDMGVPSTYDWEELRDKCVQLSLFDEFCFAHLFIP